MFWKTRKERTGQDSQLPQKLLRAQVGTCGLTCRQLPGTLGTTGGHRDRLAPKVQGSEVVGGGSLRQGHRLESC